MTTKQNFLLWSALCLCVGLLGFSVAQEPKTSPLTQGEFTADLNGLKLWFKVSGAGPVCLMPTPAWGPSSDLWFRTLKPLEKKFTIVYLDSRGTGQSQRAKTTQEYRWDHLVADLDALRSHLKQEKVWLMGHSEGGMEILHYACKHPERVSGLVLLTTAAAMDEQLQKEMMSRLQRRKDEPWFGEAIKAFQTEFTSDEQLKTEFAKMLPLYWSDPNKIANHQEDFQAISWSAEAWRAQRESRRFPFDLTGQLKQVKAPALIVFSDDDIFPPESAKRLHLCLPNSKLLLIEKAGHFPWLEQPDTFFADVPEFLRALNSAP